MKHNYNFNWLISKLDKTKCSSQIEAFIISAIRSKELIAGDLLPSYRELAQINMVSASSVRRAYTKLMNGNWLTSHQGSGTLVSANNPTEDIPHRTSGFTDSFPAGLVFLNKRIDPHPEVYIEHPYIFIGTDFPNPSNFPEQKFSEYYTHFTAASRNMTQAELLARYDGHYLKDALIDHLNRARNFGIKHNMLEVVRGRKSSLRRTLKILLSPGEVVINTSPYDEILLAELSQCQAQVFTISRQEEDFIERIEQILLYTKVRAIHIRPQCSFPEGLTLMPDQCKQLVELAKKHRVCIIEEDDEHEFWYGNFSYIPLACYDHGGYVIYTGCLSKATPDMHALRLIVASSQFVKELASLPAQSIETRDIIKEQAIAEMIMNGDLADYDRPIRIKAKNYKDELDIVLTKYLSKYINYRVPISGLTYWIKFADFIDLNHLLSKLELMGIPVPYHPNNKKTSEKVNFMVLGFGAFNLEEAEGAAKMLGDILAAGQGNYQ